MNNYIKDGLKVLSGYGVAVVLFMVFLSAFFSNIMIYSVVLLAILIVIQYTDIKRIAIKEKKGYSKVPCYPIKGLVIGFIGFSPIILIELIYPIIEFNNKGLNNFKHLILNSFMSPLYPVYKIFNETFIGYALASLIVPIIVMLGYLAGYYGFRVKPISKLSTKPQNTPQNK